MTDDELVERFFPCDRIICGCRTGHSRCDEYCAGLSATRPDARRRRPRGGALKRVRRVCHDCGGCGMRAIFSTSADRSMEMSREGCKEFGALGFTCFRNQTMRSARSAADMAPRCSSTTQTTMVLSTAVTLPRTRRNGRAA